MNPLNAALPVASTAILSGTTIFLRGADHLLGTIAFYCAICGAVSIVLKMAQAQGVIKSFARSYVLTMSILLVGISITQYLWIDQFSPLDSSREEYAFDAVTYDFYASIVAKDPSEVSADEFARAPDALGYYYPLGLIYYVFGDDTIFAGQVNLVLYILTVFALLTFLKAECGLVLRDMHIFAVLLVPEAFYLSAIPAKDMFVALLSMLVIVNWFRVLVTNDSWVRRSLTSAILLIALYFVRPNQVMALLVILVIAAMIRWFGRARSRAPAVMASIAAGIVVSYLFSDEIKQIFENVLEVGVYHLERTEGVENSISYMLIPTTPSEFIVLGIVRMVLLLLAPAPHFLAFLEQDGYSLVLQGAQSATTLLILILFPYFVAGLRTIYSRNRLVCVVLTTFALMALYFGALGSLFVHTRYRLLFTIVYFVTVAVGASARSERSCVVDMSRHSKLLTGA